MTRLLSNSKVFANGAESLNDVDRSAPSANEMRPNWFIAFRIRPHTWFDAVRTTADIRRELAADLHLTVAFLGAVSEDEASIAFEHAFDCTCEAIQITLGHLILLGSPHKRVVCASVERERARVSQLMSDVRDSLSKHRVNAPIDMRRPLPHITVARLQPSASQIAEERAVRWATSIDLQYPSIFLQTLALYRSAPKNSDTLFEIVRERALQDGKRESH